MAANGSIIRIALCCIFCVRMVANGGVIRIANAYKWLHVNLVFVRVPPPGLACVNASAALCLSENKKSPF